VDDPMSAAQRVLVTGEHGYIGSVLSRRLAEAGHQVVGLDSLLFEGCDFGPPPTRPTDVRRDVRDVTPEDLAGIDAVVHLAALSNDPLGDLDPGLTLDINLGGSVHLARTSRDAGVRRFVFASSCSMYGAAGGDEALDEDAPLRPLTAYAESKVRFEEALTDLADDSFVPVSMRNATAYGVSPRLRLDIVVNNLVAWAHTAGTIRLQSDGRSWRPLVHIDDISGAALTLLEAPSELVSGRAFNIGAPDENYLVRELAELVRERYPACAISFADGSGADPRSYRVDFRRFAQTFPAHRFRWSVAQGVAELADAFAEVGLTREDVSGDRYIRLHHLLRMRESGELDRSLRRC
jgi:nucleoside-diphosphate-sugar epimerase